MVTTRIKPRRPSHAYHTYWIARLRLCLDAEVRPGNQSAAADNPTGAETALPLLTQCGDLPMDLVSYDYIVLVTTLPYEAPALAALYRERGDAENPFNKLKNQWGWARFTTQDFARCQVTASLFAQIYNWWSLFARLVDREKHREAVTTCPELLGGVPVRPVTQAKRASASISATPTATESNPNSPRPARFYKAWLQVRSS